MVNKKERLTKNRVRGRKINENKVKTKKKRKNACGGC